MDADKADNSENEHMRKYCITESKSKKETYYNCIYSKSFV